MYCYTDTPSVILRIVYIYIINDNQIIIEVAQLRSSACSEYPMRLQ